MVFIYRNWKKDHSLTFIFCLQLPAVQAITEMKNMLAKVTYFYGSIINSSVLLILSLNVLFN